MSEWQETEIGRIPSDWSLMTVDEIKDNKRNAIAMGPFGSNIKSDNFVLNGVPVIRGNNLVDFIFNEEEFVYLKEKKADSLKASLCYSGDLIFTHRGTIGQVGLIPDNSKFKKYIVSQSGMKLSCNSEMVDNEFVFLFFKTKMGQHLLLRNSSQTGVPSIAKPTTSLKEIPIPIPPLAEAKRIKDIIFCIQKKINNLQQQNQTLEKIAQTLFKQWFVDFNFPDENGKPYKDNGGEMVGSELGEIPKNWCKKTLEEIVLNYDSKRIPLSSRQRGNKQGKYPYYGASGIVDYIDQYIFEGDYILFSEDGENLRSRKQPIVFLVDGNFWVNNHAHILKGKKEFYFYFIYLYLSSLDITHIITGAVQPKVNKSNLHSLELAFPDDSKVLAFDNFASPMFTKIKINQTQIQTLTKTRDTLLPKLMSGQIRIKE